MTEPTTDPTTEPAAEPTAEPTTEATVESTDASTAESPAHPRPSRRARLGSFAIDLLPGLAVVVAAVLAALTFPRFGPWWWGWVVLAAAALPLVLANRLLPRSTGRGAARRPVSYAVAAVLVAATAAASFFLVYQRDHRADVARAQVSRQGPKIVADMLSYEPASLGDDFARARTLATPKYLEQLVPQQDAIRDAKDQPPVPNLYRVADAAVLGATPDRVAMLMFLQGQRGLPGKERLITATLRVDFTRSSGAWLVDGLSVVGKPFAEEGEK